MEFLSIFICWIDPPTTFRSVVERDIDGSRSFFAAGTA
jgi:hypothetical protein